MVEAMLQKGIVPKEALVEKFRYNPKFSKFYNMELKEEPIDHVVVLSGISSNAEFESFLKRLGYKTRWFFEYDRGQDVSAAKYVGDYVFPFLKLFRRERKHLRFWEIDGKYYGTAHRELSYANIFREPKKTIESHKRKPKLSIKENLILNRNYKKATREFYFGDLSDVPTDSEYLEHEKEFAPKIYD